jgi:branched-chain amino acid aminotransferase
MKECIGSFFYENGVLKPCSEFEDCFLTAPFYLYEVFRVIHGVPLFFGDHLQRLEHNTLVWNNKKELVPSDLLQMVRKLIEVNELEHGNMKIVIHQKADVICKDLFLIYVTGHLYPTPVQYEQGVDVLLLQRTRSNPNLKIMDVQLRQYANEIKHEQDVWETLLVDPQGFITEGSRSNVFMIKDDKLFTPPLEDVLPGVTRKHVIDICMQHGIAFSERKISVNDLGNIDAVFLSGTSIKVLPVRSIENKQYNIENPVLRLLQNSFNSRVNEYVRLRIKS